jgi:hypothetical protein
MEFVEMGIAIIPILYRSKKPHSRLLPGGSWEPYQTRLPDAAEINRWQSAGLTNWAVVTGWENLVILDFDNPAGLGVFRQTTGNGRLGQTLQVSTGRGMHFYYQLKTLPPHTMKWAGGEIKSTGYCLIPPSIHPTGRKYQWVNPGAEILTVASLEQLLPDSVFQQCNQPPAREPLPPAASLDPFNPPLQTADFERANRYPIAGLFDDIGETKRPFKPVYCPFHGDGAKHGKKSGWINTETNRFGCSVCINGSLGVVDFVAQLQGVDPMDAANLINSGLAG